MFASVAAITQGRPEEQVGARGDGAAAFPAGERMRADVAGEVGAGSRSAVSGAAFTLATSVTRASRMRGELARDDLRRDIRRHRDDDQLRVVVVLARRATGAVVDRESRGRRASCRRR